MAHAHLRGWPLSKVLQVRLLPRVQIVVEHRYLINPSGLNRQPQEMEG